MYEKMRTNERSIFLVKKKIVGSVKKKKYFKLKHF